VKQSRPPLTSILPVARSQKWSLKSALNTVEFHEAHAEIPDVTVALIRDYWLSLLNDVRPIQENSPHLVISNKVTLFARTAGDTILEGQLPPEAHKYRRIYAVEEIVDNLVKICAEPKGRHDVLFRKIEAKARLSKDVR
jgi:hypothetical protein